MVLLKNNLEKKAFGLRQKVLKIVIKGVVMASYHL